MKPEVGKERAAEGRANKSPPETATRRQVKASAIRYRIQWNHVYSGHPWETTCWLPYRGDLCIQCNL